MFVATGRRGYPMLLQATHRWSRWMFSKENTRYHPEEGFEHHHSTIYGDISRTAVVL